MIVVSEFHLVLVLVGYHDLPKRTGTDRNGLGRTYEIPKRTSMGTETDRNGLQWVLKQTETDFSSYRNELQWEPEKLGWNNPNKSMYVLVGRYVGMYVWM